MFEIIQATPDDAMTISQIKICSWKKAYKDILPAAYLDSLDILKRADKYRCELSLCTSIYSFIIKFI